MSIHLLILEVKTHCFHNSIQLEPPTVRAVVATLGECTNRTSNLLQWSIPFLRCQVPGVWKPCRKTQIFHVLSRKPCQYYFLFAAWRYPTTLKPNECISQRNCHLQEWSCEQHWTYPQIRFNVSFPRLLDLQDKRPILTHQCKPCFSDHAPSHEIPSDATREVEWKLRNVYSLLLSAVLILYQKNFACLITHKGDPSCWYQFEATCSKAPIEALRTLLLQYARQCMKHVIVYLPSTKCTHLQPMQEERVLVESEMLLIYLLN